MYRLATLVHQLATLMHWLTTLMYRLATLMHRPAPLLSLSCKNELTLSLTLFYLKTSPY